MRMLPGPSLVSVIVALSLEGVARSQTFDFDTNNPVWSNNPNSVSAKVVWNYPATYTIDKVEIILYKVGTPDSVITQTNIITPPAIPLSGNATLSANSLTTEATYYVKANLYWHTARNEGVAAKTSPQHSF